MELITAMFDSFLELKVENEHLRHQLRKLIELPAEANGNGSIQRVLNIIGYPHPLAQMTQSFHEQQALN